MLESWQFRLGSAWPFSATSVRYSLEREEKSLKHLYRLTLSMETLIDVAPGAYTHIWREVHLWLLSTILKT
jgi:hypothetical protein